MNGESESAPFGQAGHAITGSGGGGAGSHYLFANLDELDKIIAEVETLRDEIHLDGRELNKAKTYVVSPGEDIMSRIEANATVDSLNKAFEHNKAMESYVDAQLAKLRDARDAYADTEAASAARLRGLDKG